MNIENQSQANIKIFQEKLFQELLKYLQQHSPFYQNHFKKHQIDIAKINTLSDLRIIPPTTKNDLQAHNEDFICVSKNRIVDYITTSGTLGEPVTFALTDADLERLALNEYLSFKNAGIDNNDVVQLMVTMDKRFMAGLAYFMGLRKLGAGVIRVGNGSPGLQLDSVQRFSPTAVVAVPSFLVRLLAFAKKEGIDLNNSSIKKAICIGEPIRDSNFELNALGRAITEQWNIQLFSTYASTEMATAFTECTAGKGGHHLPSLIIMELLDDRGNQVAEGEPGEMTISTLGIEAMPLLRFKTGDICTFLSAPCSCGRNTNRIGPIIGRKQQMIKYKGTTLYPPAIFDVLNGIDQIKEYVIEFFTNAIGTDEILIKIVAQEESNAVKLEIQDQLQTKLRVKPAIEFLEMDALMKIKFPKMSRKPLSIIDKRND